MIDQEILFIVSAILMFVFALGQIDMEREAEELKQLSDSTITHIEYTFDRQELLLSIIEDITE